MYLSRLILNANHPQAKSEGLHPYELHRTICKAFDDPEAARILFRADTDRPGRMHVIVQSLTMPRWPEPDGKYILSLDEPKVVELERLSVGMPLRFRLRCRPSKRIGEPGNEERGKRKALTDKDEILVWLMRKAEENGFEVKDVAFDRIYWHESRDGKETKPLGAVQFEGVLAVTDPDKLKRAVRNGIGPQKAYGFGLLSLARCE